MTPVCFHENAEVVALKEKTVGFREVRCPDCGAWERQEWAAGTGGGNGGTQQETDERPGYTQYTGYRP